MSMVSKHCVQAVILILLISCLPACGGGGSKTVVSNRTTTQGQELLDLKRAFEQGALSEREYEKQRKKVLEADD